MPTLTFPITASANDKTVTATGSSYPPTGTPSHDATGTSILVDKSFGAGPVYSLYTGNLKWVTSSLGAGANVTSATLRIFVVTSGIVNADSRSLTAEWHVFDGTASDWTSTVGTSANAGVTLASLTANSTNDIPLTNLSNVSRTGTTGLRLHISGGAPTGNNDLYIASYDDSTAPEPQLIITYSLGGGDLLGMVGI